MTESSRRYVVRDPLAVLSRFGASLGGAVIFAAVLGFGQGRWGVAGLMAGLIVLFTGNSARHAWTRLSVGPEGIATSMRSGRRSTHRALSRWETIRRVELVPAAELLRVVLRSDAPLPDWVSGRIIDPNEPEAGGSWDRQVPDLDPVALELAVRAHAPEIEVRTVR